MQIMLNIPYVIPQVIVDRILKQVESQLMMKDYLGQRAQRGQRDKFLAVLDAATDVEPILGDEL